MTRLDFMRVMGNGGSGSTRSDSPAREPRRPTPSICVVSPRLASWHIACSPLAVPSVDPDPSWDTVKEILRYFLRNPRAVDSVEGVARWRVMEEQVHRSLEQTQSALAWLLSEGYLEELQTAGTSRIVRLNPDRQAVAAHFLANPPGTSTGE
jgi:hypothetical protein